MTRIAYKRYTAIISDAKRDDANAALEAVSGNFENFFGTPCNYEADDENTIRAWTCGQVLLKPSQRQLGKQALQDAGIASPHLEYTEVEARGTRFQNAVDLFLAEYQLRRTSSFVHVTGMFRADGSADAQTVTSTPQLINQWTSTDELRNCAVSGDGNRLEVDFAGTYYLEARLLFEETEDEFVFQLVKNTTYISGQFSTVISPATGDRTVDSVLATDKFGIGVSVASGSASLNMLGGWFGLKRIA